MINSISLRNFKCFEELSVDLKKVNILTGLNGMGKSTLIQSILLMKQSEDLLPTKGRLLLQGEYINLGEGKDILYEAAGENQDIVIDIEKDGKYGKYVFDYNPYADYLELKETESESRIHSWNNTIYLSAFRIAPKRLYDISNEKDVKNHIFGADGIYTIQYLNLFGAKPILQEMVTKEEEYPNTLTSQTERWLSEIAPGISVNTLLDNEKKIVQLGYTFKEGEQRTNVYSSVNVGFGITYVLPIIVALLSAQKEDVILIENPEAYIHPKGQRKLGELIALAGKAGIQIIVETHSDHILNGIRLAVKQKQLQPKDTNILYFYKDTEDKFKHKYVVPHINAEGRIDNWPEGFFDEWDNALMELL